MVANKDLEEKLKIYKIKSVKFEVDGKGTCRHSFTHGLSYVPAKTKEEAETIFEPERKDIQRNYQKFLDDVRANRDKRIAEVKISIEEVVVPGYEITIEKQS